MYFFIYKITAHLPGLHVRHVGEGGHLDGEKGAYKGGPQATGHPKCELRHLDLLRQVPREADPHVAPCQPWDAGQNPIVVL